jgi:hypothetical protein
MFFGGLMNFSQGMDTFLFIFKAFKKIVGNITKVFNFFKG